MTSGGLCSVLVEHKLVFHLTCLRFGETGGYAVTSLSWAAGDSIPHHPAAGLEPSRTKKRDGLKSASVISFSAPISTERRMASKG